MKKDKNLQKLFTDYSPNFAPHNAETVERAQNVVKNKREQNRRTRKISFKSVAVGFGCVVFALLFMSFGLLMQSSFNKGNNVIENNSNSASVEIVDTSPYQQSDLKYKTLSATEVESFYSLDCFNSYNMVQEKYYGFYFKNGNSSAKENLAFILVEASFVNGMNRCDIELIVEVTNRNYKEKESYKNLPFNEQINGVRIYGATSRIDGEFYSKSYFEENGYKFYLQTTSANKSLCENFVQELI